MSLTDPPLPPSMFTLKSTVYEENMFYQNNLKMKFDFQIHLSLKGCTNVGVFLIQIYLLIILFPYIHEGEMTLT